MICVAICDDTPGIRDLLGQYFRRFGKENQLPLSVDAYECGNQLLTADYLKYDLLILDVQMGEPNGIETARCIRKAGGSMVIIFFTNYVQYALEGYEVQAFRFLLKPLTYEQFSDVAGNALLQMQRMRQESLNIHQKDSVIRVPWRIFCISKQNADMLLYIRRVMKRL